MRTGITCTVAHWAVGATNATRGCQRTSLSHAITKATTYWLLADRAAGARSLRLPLADVASTSHAVNASVLQVALAVRPAIGRRTDTVTGLCRAARCPSRGGPPQLKSAKTTLAL
jgi:hypothetical protein